MLPNTFIAGAQKSGTTTLCETLARHPQVVVSEPKEPIFFSKAANLATLEVYEACFKRKDKGELRAVIDGSNAYMTDPNAVIRICETLGKDLQFIFSLRDPVRRMVSGYWHQAKKAQDRRSLTEALCFVSASLDEAVQEEDERLQDAVFRGSIDVEVYADSHDDPLWNFRYLRNSLYASDLQRFRDTFGVAQVKVLLFEDMIRDPMSVLSTISAFLNLELSAFPEHLDLHRNPTRLPRLPGLLSFSKRVPVLSLLRGVPGYGATVQSLFYRSPGRAPLELTARWRQLFAPETARLQIMLGRDLSPLWSGA